MRGRASITFSNFEKAAIEEGCALAGMQDTGGRVLWLVVLIVVSGVCFWNPRWRGVPWGCLLRDALDSGKVDCVWKVGRLFILLGVW